MDILDIALASKLAKGGGGQTETNTEKYFHFIDDAAIYAPEEYEGCEGDVEGEAYLIFSDNDCNLPIYTWTWRNGKWDIKEVKENSYILDRYSNILYRYSGDSTPYLTEIVKFGNYYQHNISVSGSHDFINMFDGAGQQNFSINFSYIDTDKNSKSTTNMSYTSFNYLCANIKGNKGNTIIGTIILKESGLQFPLTSVGASTKEERHYLDCSYINANKKTSFGISFNSLTQIEDIVSKL